MHYAIFNPTKRSLKGVDIEIQSPSYANSQQSEKVKLLKVATIYRHNDTNQ